MKTSTPFAAGTYVTAYLRDSGHEDQELSVDQQEAAIRNWCLDNGLVLTRVFTDAAAPGSSTIGRTAFMAMINHFHDPACTDAGVILWKYNRFARDIDDAQFYKADLRRRGYIIHSLNDSVPDGLDGRFFEAAIDWMNARYLEDLRSDIKRGQLHLLEQYGALGGRPPRGFVRESVEIGQRRDGRPHIVHRWTPDPDWTDRIRLAFSMRAEGRSYREINQVTRLYKSHMALKDFFNNPIYTGRMIFSGRIFDHYCEPIIDLKTWEAVQKMSEKRRYDHLTGDNTNHPRRANSRFLLSGLVRCAECGALMNGSVHRIKGRSYGYYRCARQHRTDGCTAPKIPQWALENAVLQNIVEHILQAENLGKLLSTYERDADKTRSELQTKRDIFTSDLQDTRRKINNLAELLSEDGLKSRALMDKMFQLEREELRLIGEIERLRDPEISTTGPAMPDMLNTAQGLIDRLTNSEDEADVKRVLTGLVDHVDAKREGRNRIVGVIYYYFPSEIKSTAEFVPTIECPRRDSNPQPRR